MAYYIQLINRETGIADTFNTIDAKLCEALEQPLSDKKYLAYWYSIIGYQTCDGATLEDVSLNLRTKGYLLEAQCIEWIATYYLLNSWHGR